MSVQSPRPWYVIDELCDEYLFLDKNSGDLRMLQVLKVLRGITLNIIIGAVTTIMVLEGGDPTLLGGIGLVGLMLVNGVEAADYLAAKQALNEAKANASDDD